MKREISFCRLYDVSVVTDFFSTDLKKPVHYHLIIISIIHFSTEFKFYLMCRKKKCCCFGAKKPQRPQYKTSVLYLRLQTKISGFERVYEKSCKSDLKKIISLRKPRSRRMTRNHMKERCTDYIELQISQTSPAKIKLPTCKIRLFNGGLQL